MQEMECPSAAQDKGAQAPVNAQRSLMRLGCGSVAEQLPSRQRPWAPSAANGEEKGRLRRSKGERERREERRKRGEEGGEGGEREEERKGETEEERERDREGRKGEKE